MKTYGAELYHDGKTWVLNMNCVETGHNINLSITDAQADKLKEKGVPVYDAGQH